MNILLVREVDILRRIAGRHIERWRANSGQVRTSEGALVADFENPEIAGYVARLHNLFVPLTNAVIEMRAKLADARRMRKELHGPYSNV